MWAARARRELMFSFSYCSAGDTRSVRRRLRDVVVVGRRIGGRKPRPLQATGVD